MYSQQGEQLPVAAFIPSLAPRAFSFFFQCRVKEPRTPGPREMRVNCAVEGACCTMLLSFPFPVSNTSEYSRVSAGIWYCPVLILGALEIRSQPSSPSVQAKRREASPLRAQRSGRLCQCQVTSRGVGANITCMFWQREKCVHSSKFWMNLYLKNISKKYLVVLWSPCCTNQKEVPETCTGEKILVSGGLS